MAEGKNSCDHIWKINNLILSLNVLLFKGFRENMES